MNRDYEDLGGRDPWSLLGVPRGADPAEIKRAYRRRTRMEHTDVGGNDDRQARLNRARDVLLDPVRRHDYEERMREATREAVRDAVRETVREEPPAPEPPVVDPFEWTSGAGPDTSRIRWAAAPPPPPPPPPPPQPAPSQPAPPPPPRQWPGADQPAYPQYQTYPQYRMYPEPPPYRTYSAGRPWNGLAVASLVVSLICWPVGMPMAVAALFQIRQRGDRGAGLAWTAICIGGLTLVWVCAQFVGAEAGAS